MAAASIEQDSAASGIHQGIMNLTKQHNSSQSSSRNTERLHPIAISQVMLNFAAANGIEPSRCLAGTGIESKLFSDSESYITRAQEMRLIANIQSLLGRGANAGFELGLQYKLATFGVWGFTLRSSETLSQAMEIALRYIPLSTAYCDLRAIKDDEEFTVAFDPTPIPDELQTFILLRDMASGINLFQELSYSGFDLKAIRLQANDAIDLSLIEAQCGIKPELNEDYNGIVVKRSDADRVLPGYDRQLFELLEIQCQNRLQRIASDSVTGQVREHLLGPMGMGCTLQDMANALLLSPRTLRRRLEQENTSYRELVDDERRQRAEFLLANSSIKIESIALELGFTDAGGFVRAFKRWHGCSPSEYRNTKQNSAP